MSISDYLSAVLHAGSQYLLVPTMVCLILLIVVTVFCLGSLLVEYFTERRHFKVNHRSVIVGIHDADYSSIGDVVRRANLLQSQVKALSGIAGNMGLPDDELFALAQLELERADGYYRRKVHVTDTVSKVAPMLGLMGTLIPLGPGIVAMGQGDVSQLSSSLLIAFDTTIAGLVAAVVALVISRIRRTWYGQYNTMMKSLMACIMEEAARAREEGVELPYGQGGDGDAAAGPSPSSSDRGSTAPFPGAGAGAAGAAAVSQSAAAQAAGIMAQASPAEQVPTELEGAAHETA